MKFMYILASPQRDRVLREEKGSRDQTPTEEKKKSHIVGCSAGISLKPVAVLHSAARHLGATCYKRNDFLKSVSLLDTIVRLEMYKL